MSKNNDILPDTLEKLNLNKFSPVGTKTSNKPSENTSSDEIKPLETEHKDHGDNDNEKIKIVDIKNTPHFLIDNEYILSGYRVHFNTKFKILKR